VSTKIAKTSERLQETGHPGRPRPRLPRVMAVWDVLVAAGVLGMVGVVHGLDTKGLVGNAGLAAVFLALGPLLLYAMGAHETATRPLGSGPTDWARLMVAAATVLWTANLVMQWRGVDADVSILALAWPILGTGWFAGRLLARRRLARRPQRTLIIGSGPTAERIVEITRRHPEHAMHVVGFVDDRATEPAEGLPPVVGRLDDLNRLVRDLNIIRVVVAYSATRDERLMEVLREAVSEPGVRLQMVPRLWELVDHDARVDALGNLALIEASPATRSWLKESAKRAFDVAVAGLGLILVAPVLALIALLIRLDSPGPAVFRQTRIGLHGREFRILKFRTMYVDADSRGIAARIAQADAGHDRLTVGDIAAAVAEMKQADDPRITRIGNVLRRTSLDELPQLWNVLRGDMSIVGPRPLRPFEVATLTDWQHRRHDVRPGITGTWQVLGRSDIPWDERMHMDHTYARYHSLRLDLRVLARTAGVVLGAKGSR